jgi:spore germination protein
MVENMRVNNEKISSLQFLMILCGSVIGVSILDFPRIAIEKVGPDSWILILIGTIIMYLVGICIFKVLDRYRGYTFFQILEAILSKPVSVVICILFSLHFMFLTSIQIRIFTEVTREYLLYNTPSEVIIISMLLCIIFLIRNGIEVIGRMAQITFPIVSVLILILLIPLIKEMDITNLLPILHTPIGTILKAIPSVIFVFAGIEVTFLLSYFVVDKDRLRKKYNISLLIIGCIYLIILVFTISRFGIMEGKRIIWPVLELFKTIDIPGSFIENVEILMISLWIVAVFISAAVWYYGAMRLIRLIWHERGAKYLLVPIGGIIYIVANYFRNVSEIMDILNRYLMTVGIFFIIGLPVILLIGDSIKKRGGSSND